MKQLEETLGVAYDSIAANPVLRKELTDLGEEDDPDAPSSKNKERPITKPGFFAAANPLRTARMLRESGYSRGATCGILFAIYAIVLVFEMLLLRLGMAMFQVDSVADLFVKASSSAGGSAAQVNGHAIEDL
eukprot:g17253.t1